MSYYFALLKLLRKANSCLFNTLLYPFFGIPKLTHLSKTAISSRMDIETEESPSKKRNMDSIEEWIKKVISFLKLSYF